MRKAQIIATALTLGLAAPFAFLAILGTAWVTDHLPGVIRSLPSVQWQSILREGSARWPEVAGMVVGQLLILALLLAARRSATAQDQA
jgi:TRAP-type C4-dicarboxylate transport system permease small subunit